jgi:xanthine dehydrogenase molybdenum-binding subunit
MDDQSTLDMEMPPIMGRPVARIDAASKVTGQTKYLPDMTFPGMLYARVLRSPIAHARIKHIDTQRARDLPGVRAVITARDVPSIKFSFIDALADKLMLCDDKVRCVGDEVAAVAADTLAIAEKALELIDVDYEPLPEILDPEEAAKDDSNLVHEEKGTNVTFESKNEWGDIEKGFEEAEFVFEDRFTTSRVSHCCLETRGCIADFPKGGRLTVWGPTQSPHLLRHEVSRILGISRGQIRVIQTPIGGAFGSKCVMDVGTPIAAMLSRLTGRPVKLCNTREEEFATARTRYPYVVYLKTGVNGDGRIIAKQAKVYVDAGAYNDRGPSTLNWAGLAFAITYNAPNGHYEGCGVYTNHQPGTAFRGFGAPQVNFAFETHLDRIAAKLGMDPFQIRNRNEIRAGQTTNCGFYVNSSGLTECIEKAALDSGWEEKRKAYDRQSPTATRRKGIGAAIVCHTGSGTRYYGYSATDTFIKLSEDGIVSVITPVVELGQGVSTGVAQIVAEVLGFKHEDIRIVTADTDIIPYDLGSFGSRTMFICGNAAAAAARDTRDEVLEVAGKILECPPDQLDIADGHVFVKGDRRNRSISTGEVAEYAVFQLGRPISGRGRYADEIAARVSIGEGYSKHVPTWAFGCQVAEVEVDLLTGQVDVLNMTAIHEAGRIINPMLAEGQMEGALAQGLGYALKEECITKQGVLQNSSFVDYKIFHAEDMPDANMGFVELTDSLGPLGAKGLGEMGLVAIAPAIANAIHHATGLELNELPMNPERILMALEKKNGGACVA